MFKHSNRCLCGSFRFNSQERSIVQTLDSCPAEFPESDELPARGRALTIFIVVICGVAFRGNALAQSDQIVYIDAPGSGWQNWSWATVNLTNTQPVQGGSDSIAVNAGAYQALYLHQTSFDSTPYNNLVFWIKGGASGGQLLQVQRR
jgi:hypothetical protein